MPQLLLNKEDIKSSGVTSSNMSPESVNYTKTVNLQDNLEIQDQGINTSSEKHFEKIRNNADESCNSMSIYRRARTAFSSAQLFQLEQEFLIDPYISRSKRKTLAELLNLPEITIKVWFQNRRMKDKRSRQNTQWQFNTQPLATVYGNTVVRNAPIYAKYPIPAFTAPSPSHGAYSPIPFYAYPDIPSIPQAPYGYPLSQHPRETLMSDITRYTCTGNVSPLESGMVPVSLSPTYGSSPAVSPLAAYYHPYPVCNTCTGAEPLNLDVKNLRREDKKVITEEAKANKVNAKPCLFRPFDE